MAHSPYAKQTLKDLKSSGSVWVFFSPVFPSRINTGDNAITFAMFHPSLLVRVDGGKSYAVVIGHHAIHWPTTEMAWLLGHELVGHGIQHFQDRLDRSRPNDRECEAFLHQERVLQELGLWKNAELMVKVRRQMEEQWCQKFRIYMAQNMPSKMALWNVRDMDVPQLLDIYRHYFFRQPVSEGGGSRGRVAQ